jgi:hypothetical protein
MSCGSTTHTITAFYTKWKRNRGSRQSHLSLGDIYVSRGVGHARIAYNKLTKTWPINQLDENKDLQV